jgi:leader peptidase (prepilin peptidase)/N-methyltransferase
VVYPSITLATRIRSLILGYNDAMELFLQVMVLVFGAIIGSFLNVVIYRMHTGKSLNGRSHCMTCGTNLSWKELFPVVSYLALRAKCRHCTAYIPWRYLFVEVLTGVSFLFLYTLYAHDLVLFALHAVLAAVLIVIAVYDLRHTIIPDELTIIAGVVAVIFRGYMYSLTHDVYALVYAGIGAFCAALFFWGLWYVSKGRWIGLGDAKLALPLGLIVGSGGVFGMVVLSFWIGAGISLMLLGVQRLLKRGKKALPFLPNPLTIKSEVPFAPFLILGFLCVHIFNADIFEIIFFFLPF